MRIDCPHCGLRSIEEFTIRNEVKPDRPGEDAGEDAYVDYVYLSNNPRGRNQEHWHHSGGCRAWLVVDRDTITHEIFSVTDVREGR
ncbi:MAG: sarcosine oxidase subunit delta [Hyphomicrobiaceae bacterium]